MLPRNDLDAAKSVCVFLPNWIGDVVMATPTLRALRQRFPAPTRIVGVMRPYVSQVLTGTPWIDDQVFYDRHGGKSDQTPRAALRQLRAHHPDVAVLLTNSLYSGWIAWRSGARRRIGYARNFRGWLLTDRLHAPRDGWKLRPWSAVDQYLTLAQSAGCDTASQRLELATLPGDETGADQVWTRLGLGGRRVILVNNGAATASAKMWPQEHVEKLCRRLVVDPEVAVLLLCGPKERDSSTATARKVGHPRVLSMADQDMALGISKAVIRRSHLLVTTDSGPRHIAAAFQVPTVAIFGSIAPAWSLNYNPHELRLAQELPCGPCGRKTCPLGHTRCIRDITVDQVLSAIHRLSNATRHRDVA